MRRISGKALAHARRARTRLKRALAGHPDVTGFSVGYRVRKRALVNTCVVRAHVRRKYPHGLLSRERCLPRRYHGVGVDVIETELCVHTCRVRRTYERTLKGGIMLANVNNRDAVGTLGGLLRDGRHEHYAISNWHVLYGRNGARDGEQVSQPKGKRGTIGETALGFIGGELDAAVCRLWEPIDGGRPIAPGIYGLETSIQGYTAPFVGMNVVKSGVNGLAYGLVESMDFEDMVPFAHGTVYLQAQVQIGPRPGKPFCVAKGDSGSLWISEADANAVCLHVGGGTGLAFGNRVDVVLAKCRSEGLRLRFVD